MNTFLFCFVLAVGLVGQAVTGASNQRNQAPTRQGNSNANTGELVKKAVDDLSKLFTNLGEQVQSTFNPQQLEDFFREHSQIFSEQTKSKFNKVVSDVKNAGAQVNLSGTSSDFNELIIAAGSDLSSAVQKFAKDIPNTSEVMESINNYVKQITEPRRN
ncbi:host translation inhibitory factor III [Bracoviriform glomeratae]|uniref:Host translation inhibitory factor III n=1 Tax=Bracoviriform glomeratae TaxID=257816 RepID=C0LJH7_9VIRU|nr:host translation inhibitory factor III [Bracoviriform glomeratae]ACN66640.1 host translation inhibitory factor III [Bracoviriform glomeratae]